MRSSVPATLAFLALTLCLNGAAVPAPAATYTIHWLLGHKNLDYFEEAALNFKQEVEKASHGDIAVDIVVEKDVSGSPAPDSGPDIADKVSKGEAEMGHSFVDAVGGLDSRFHAFEAPYLFRGYRHLEGVFEGPLGPELLEGLRSRGVVGLSFTYSGGASGVATTGREIRTPVDLKGLKVGVIGDVVDSAWLKSLSAVPVAIGHDLEKAAPLARKGGLDAVIVTWRNFERTALDSDFKHVNLMGSTYLVSVTYVNARFFDGLPEAYRALIARASHEAGRIERAKTIELNENARLEMLGKGVRAVHLTQANRSWFNDALRPAYQSSIEAVVGKDLLERIKNTPDAPEAPSIPLDLARR